MKITLKDGSVFEGTAQEYAELVKLGEGIAESKDEYVPKVGDKVRALSDSEFRDIKEGEIGAVEGIHAGKNGFDEFKIEVSTAKTYCYFRPQDLEKVGECDTPNFEAGDYVVALPTADERYLYTNSEMHLGKVEEKVGDSIRIRIVAHDRAGFVDAELFYVDSEHFRKATDEEVAKFKNEYIPKEGDIVVITSNTNGSINKVGDIGRVGERIGSEGVQVHVPGKPNGLFGGNYTRFDEMRPATEEEKKQYEQAEKFAKLGRKPGEFKKGDIVRYIRNGDKEKGMIVEVVDDSVNGRTKVDFKGTIYGICTEQNEDLELIAPVESRVDLDD